MTLSKSMSSLAAVVLLVVVPLFAEDDSKAKTIEKNVVFTAPAPPPFLSVNAMPFDQMIDMKVVTGAPYSAVADTEAVQTLGDGNRLVRRNSTQVARDSQGRTRHEYSFPGSEDVKLGTIISINDPTTGITYTLHTETKTAEKVGLPEMLPGEPSRGVVVTEDVEGPETAAAPEAGAQFIYRKTGPGGGEMGNVAYVAAPHIVRFKITMAGGEIDDNANTEQLGKQVIEGVETEGKRTTITIPAGQIGNERPIVITNEVWYSPELQTIVYSKRDDPMAGITIFKLTNIVRAEPDASLFQVPPDYKVESPEVKMKFFQNKLPKPGKK